MQKNHVSLMCCFEEMSNSDVQMPWYIILLNCSVSLLGSHREEN